MFTNRRQHKSLHVHIHRETSALADSRLHHSRHICFRQETSANTKRWWPDDIGHRQSQRLGTMHITQETSGVDRLCPVHITQRSLSLEFSYNPLFAQNKKLTSDVVYLYCPDHAYFSTDVGYGLPASAGILAHRLAIFKHGPLASTLDCKKMLRQH